MNIYDKIRSAIKNQKMIAAIHNNEYFEGCPHVLGSKFDTTHSLFCKSCKSAMNQWACIPIEELADVKIIEKNYTCIAYSSPKITQHIDHIDYILHFDVDL